MHENLAAIPQSGAGYNIALFSRKQKGPFGFEISNAWLPMAASSMANVHPF
jgi:hypothetical protein